MSDRAHHLSSLTGCLEKSRKCINSSSRDRLKRARTGGNGLNPDATDMIGPNTLRRQALSRCQLPPSRRQPTAAPASDPAPGARTVDVLRYPQRPGGVEEIRCNRHHLGMVPLAGR